MMITQTKTDAIVNVESPDQFEKVVLNAEVPVLLDLWAPWCGPCRLQGPILEELVTQVGGRARIVKANVDVVPEIAMKLGVHSIPTFIIFRDGKEERRFVGVQSAVSLVQSLGV